MPASKPEETALLFGEALRQGDLDAVVALYEPDATLLAGPTDQPAIGLDAIREVLGGIAEMIRDLTMNPRLISQTEDLAVIYTDWSAKGKDAQGKDTRIIGSAIEVLRRQQDGTWKFVFDDAFARGQGPEPP